MADAAEPRYVTTTGIALSRDDGKPRKVKVMTPYTPRWEAAANKEAREAVQIHPCQRCGHPTVNGYQCNTCGETDP